MENSHFLQVAICSVPQWPSDISNNDWPGPVNSSLAADLMSDEIFGANHVFLVQKLQMYHLKNSVKTENVSADYKLLFLGQRPTSF